jgi:hypothetical protein
MMYNTLKALKLASLLHWHFSYSPSVTYITSKTNEFDFLKRSWKSFKLGR